MKSRHKIAYILTPVTFGGAERVSLNYLRNADLESFDIHPILLTRPWEEESYFARELRVRGYSLEIIPVAKRKWGDVMRIPRAFSMLYSLIRGMSCDLIHTHGYFADIMGLPISRILGIPSISTCHGFINTDAKLRLYNKLDLLSLRFGRRVLCVSEGLRSLVIQSGVAVHNVRSIHNAVEVDRDGTDSGVMRQRTRQVFGIAEDEIVLGYCGRLSPEKGLQYLVEALPILLAAGLPVRMLLVGDGPQRQNIQSMVVANRVQDRVIFAGFREEVSDLMSAMDVFVLPSLTEGTPMALLEAMGHGVPVVASAVGEIPTIVCQDENGILVRPGQAEEIVEAVRRIAENSGLRKQLSHKAVETVRSRYNLKPWICEIEAHYRELIDAANNSLGASVGPRELLPNGSALEARSKEAMRG